MRRLGRIGALGLSLLGALPLAADPPGVPGGTITVVDEQGQPIPGARLSPAVPNAAGVPELDPVGVPGIAAGPDGVLALPREREPVGGGAWVVWAPGRGLKPLAREQPGGRLTLTQGVEVTGTVRWSGGRAAAALALLVEPLGVPQPVGLRLETDAAGRYRTDLLSGASWRLSFQRQDGRWVPLRTIVGGVDAPAVAPLPGGLEGRLIDGRARGTVGVPALPLRFVPLPRARERSVAPLETVSGPDGRLVLLDLAAGIYELELLDPDWMFDQPAARVEIPGEGIVRHEQWYVMRRARLRGQVLGHERKPLAGARVRLLLDPRLQGVPTAPPEPPAAVATDLEGRFTFVRLLPSAGCRVLVSAPGFAPSVSEAFDIEPGEPTQLSAISLSAGWSLDVEVRDASARLLGGVSVHVSAAGHPSAGSDPALEALRAVAKTDEQGVASFTGLADEDVWLTLEVPGRLPVAERVGQAGSARYVRYRLLLVAAPALQGRVSDAQGRPAPGLSVRAHPRGLPSGAARQVATGPDGRFLLQDLAPQVLDVDVLEAGGRPLLHVEGVDPDQGTLELALPELETVTGTVEGLLPGGPSAQVLLEAPVLLPDEPEPRWRVVDRRTLAAGARAAPFRFEGLAPGPYGLRAVQGGRDSDSLPFDVGPEPAEERHLLLPEGGSVAGAVNDARGRPVLGARVTLVRLRADGASADRPEGPLSAASGERGAYLFSGVAPGLWRVEVEERGLGRDLEVLRLLDGESLVVRDLQLSGGARLEGRVEDRRGRPVDGARLVLRALEGDLEPRETSTGGDGGYRLEALPPGPYELFLTDGPEPQNKHGARVQLRDGETTRMDFVAQGGAELEGTVMRTGHRAAGVALRVDWTPEDGEALARSLRVLTDGTGEFHLEGLAAGRYRLTLEDGTSRTGGEVVLEDGERRTVELELWSGRLVGEVRTSDDRPVGNALVTATPLVPIAGVLSASVRTDPHGRFTLSGLPVARYDLVARGPGSLRGTSSAAQADLAGAEHPTLIVLEVGGALDVQVRGPDGRPAGSTRLTVSPAASATQPEVTAVTGPDGRARLDGMAVGRVRIEAFARDLGRTSAWVEVEAQRETPVRLVLLPCGSLSLEVSGATPTGLERAEVEVRSAASQELLLRRSPVGGAAARWSGLSWLASVLRARDLPAGDYEVRIDLGRARAAGRALVRVRAGEDTHARLTLTSGDR